MMRRKEQDSAFWKKYETRKQRCNDEMRRSGEEHII